MTKNKKIAVVISAIVILLVFFGYEIKKIDEKKLNEQEKNAAVTEENQDNILPNWKIPEDEIFIDSLSEDTNQDNLKETLVIAENTRNPLKKKAYFYIFNKNGEKIYYKESGLSPDGIELRKFGDDNYQSFFLVFEGQFQEGFFIRWNGKEYVIPGEEKD